MTTIAKEWVVFRMLDPSQDGVCAAEVLRLEDGRHAVIVEELEENPGQSVSNGWEAVVKAMGQKYKLSIAHTCWIEHDSDPEPPRVKEFGHWQIVTFTPPKSGQIEGKA